MDRTDCRPILRRLSPTRMAVLSTSLALAVSVTPALAAPDLDLWQSTSSPTVAAAGTGPRMTYAIVVTNRGPDAAAGVVLLDPLPAGITFESVLSVNGGGSTLSCGGPAVGTNGTVTCTGAMPSMAASTITIEAGVSQAAKTGPRTNTATVATSTPEADPDVYPNSASVEQLIIGATDLGITKITGNPTPTVGGAAFSYTLTVTNNGPNDATGIVVLDPMPPGIIFHNVSVVNNPSLAGWGLTCDGPPTRTNGTVSCTGNLPAPTVAPNPVAISQAVITIVAQVEPDLASGVRTNTATVLSDTPETIPNVFPNTASLQQTLVVDAPLTLAMTATPSVIAGDEVFYRVTVLNGGSSSALNSTITLNLPAGTQFVSLLGSGPLHKACWANGGGSQVVCNPKLLPTGNAELLVIAETFVTTTGPLTGSATLTPGTGTASGTPANDSTDVVVNLAPVAVGDSYLTNQNVPLVVATLGVKGNDSDDEDLQTVFTAALVGGPTNGTLTTPLGANGSFTYTPNPGYSGPDSFTYQLTDSRGLVSNTATVSITVNGPPVAGNDGYFTGINTPLAIAALGVKANDSDDLDTQAVLVASLVSGPSFGTLTVNLAADGSFTYTPNPGYTGTDTFTYRVTDSNGLQSNIATVSITVHLPPVAANDQYSTLVNVPRVVATLGVKENDSDDLDAREALVASLVTGPSNGTLTGPLAADGSFTYTPNPGFFGVDSFTYIVTDANGLQSNVATVLLFVQRNSIPVSPWTAGMIALLLALLGSGALRSRVRQAS